MSESERVKRIKADRDYARRKYLKLRSAVIAFLTAYEHGIGHAEEIKALAKEATRPSRF